MKQFQITTNVSAEFLADAESDLIAVMHERLLKYRDRFMPPEVRIILLRLVTALSLLGLILLGVIFALDWRRFIQSPCMLELAALFLLFLAFSLYQKRRAGMMPVLFRGYWSWLAKSRANAMLSRARKLAPFVATYDFRGASAVYHRTQHGEPRFIWTRRFKGFRLTRKNYTLLYTKKKSLYPYAIVLHDPSMEFETYLDELGIPTLPEYGARQ